MLSVFSVVKIDMIDFQKQYPPPASFKRPDGSTRFAFMTFVMRNDSFTPGALVFAYALRQQRTQADLVCMVTKDVTPAARSALEILFDQVVEVNEIFIPHKRRQERQDRPFLFTRFQALRAGADGVAVISAVVGAEDVEAAARRIKEAIRGMA